jgi:2-polyprenyl-6-methoxyphenol hydroxylase-like FAD-dependent oxidoreductase
MQQTAGNRAARRFIQRRAEGAPGSSGPARPAGQRTLAGTPLMIQRYPPATEMRDPEVEDIKANLDVIATLQPKEKLSVLKGGSVRARFKAVKGGIRRLHQAAVRFKKGESVDVTARVLSEFFTVARDLMNLQKIPANKYAAAQRGYYTLRQTYSGKTAKLRKLDAVVTGQMLDVLVMGAGPAGLAAAIEARLAGANVSVVDSRSGAYSRENVLQLTTETLGRLHRLGVYEELFEADDAPGALHGTEGHLPIVALEQALRQRALDLGVTITYNEEVAAIAKVQAAPGKSQATINQIQITKGKGGVKKTTVTGTRTVTFDLVVAAYGSSASRLNTPKLLGINVEPVSDKKVYVGVGLFAPSYTEDMSEKQQKIKEEGLEEVEMLGSIPLRSRTVHYILAPLFDDAAAQAREDDLAGKDFRDCAWLWPLLTRSAREFGLMGNLKQGYWFPIELQKASAFTSAKKGAMIIGDAAATPHPGSGSGANTAFALLGPFSEVVKGAMKTISQEERARFLARFEEAATKETDKMLDKAQSFF